MPTVFEKIVKNENDHSNLLSNLMARDVRIADVALSYLLYPEPNGAGRRLSQQELASFEFQTQYSVMGENGREIPDLIVRNRDRELLIETKIDAYLGLSPAQKAGYPSCFSPQAARHLTFLIPRGYTGIGDLESIRTSNRDISVKIAFWPTLVKRLSELSKSLSDEVLNETVRFWREWFEDIQMTDAEKELLRPWPIKEYTAIRKIDKLIVQLAKLLKGKGWSVTQIYSDMESNGFYVMNGNKCVLWVGTWVKFKDSPVNYGFESKKNWEQPITQPPDGGTIVDFYRLWPIQESLWNETQETCEMLDSFLRTIFAHASFIP